jgi:hypothetical protein
MWAGVSKEKRSEFLQARERDISAAARPEWSAWLAELAVAPSRRLRAWVLARRLEGGDTRWYPEYERMAFDYVRDLSSGGGPSDDRPTRSAFNIDSRSTFWASFEKTLRKDPALKVTDGMYAFWCLHTQQEQRELIFDVAKSVLLKGAGRNYSSPKDDPRFWIVMDWLYSCGSEDDFARVQELLPKKAKSTFTRLSKEASKLPGFFVDGRSPLNQILNTKAFHLFALGEPSDEGEATGIGVHTAVAKSKPRIPDYPREASSMRLGTDLNMEMIIGEDGRSVSCRPAPGPWLLFFAPFGVKYAMGYEFQPLPAPTRFILRVQLKYP